MWSTFIKKNTPFKYWIDLVLPAVIPCVLHLIQSSSSRKRYQEMVGCPMWLAIMTRPDIAAATSKLAQFLANPPSLALEAANHVYRYLCGTIDLVSHTVLTSVTNCRFK